MRWICSMLVCLILGVSGPAIAQITNGTFDDSLEGWTLTFPEGDVTNIAEAIQVAGACPGYAGTLFTFVSAAPGLGCFSQEFECQSLNGQCAIMFSYEFENSYDPNVRAVVRLDGTEVFSQTTRTPECTSVGPLEIGCGTHTIELCLDVLAVGVVAAHVTYDNVVAICGALPVEQSSWGAIKALFR